MFSPRGYRGNLGIGGVSDNSVVMAMLLRMLCLVYYVGVIQYKPIHKLSPKGL